jgi:glycosyltransferase involved in cell wall biosynthesis
VVALDDYDPANREHVVITFDGDFTDVRDYAAPLLQAFGYPFELCVGDDRLGEDRSGPEALASEAELQALVAMGGRIRRQAPDGLARVVVTSDTAIAPKGRVAVIIASYNYGRFLPEAVESVLRQSQAPDEILIMDDCSSDETEEIGRAYAQQYPTRVRYHRNATNLGIVANFNAAVALTSADYICFLGADNRFRSDYVEQLTGVLEREPAVAIAYTDFALFGPRARLLYNEHPETRRGRVVRDIFFEIRFPDFDDAAKRMLETGNFIHGSAMYRRTAFDQVGGYVFRQEGPEDHHLFLRMVRAGWGARRVPGALLEYRQHSNEQANIRMNSDLQLQFYKERVRELENSLNAVYESTSWRLTRPLRALVQCWRGRPTSWSQFRAMASTIKSTIGASIYQSNNIWLNRAAVFILNRHQQKTLGGKYRASKVKTHLGVDHGIPRLAWHCEIDASTHRFTVGTAVEWSDNFVFEGSWDGEFAEAAFDHSDFVFGSGARIEPTRITFVPPKHVVEALYVLVDRHAGTSSVSNSLCFLLKRGNIDLDGAFFGKLSTRLNEAINDATAKGIDQYTPMVAETEGYALLRMMYHNFSVDNAGQIKIWPRLPREHFRTYDEYRNFLGSKIGQILNNSRSGLRKIPFKPVATISRGYDSPTVAALAREHGCRDALTFDVSVHGMDDSGAELGAMLGYDVASFRHIMGKARGGAEVIENLRVEFNDHLADVAREFVATGGIGDDVAFHPFQERLADAVLLTGTFGDTIWEKTSPKSAGLRFASPFTKSITEFRLRVGFHFVPAPFIAARFSAPIAKISNSEELGPFSNGTQYDRPICRRILEEAGIPRGMFGAGKNATAPLILNHADLFKQAVAHVMARY